MNRRRFLTLMAGLIPVALLGANKAVSRETNDERNEAILGTIRSWNDDVEMRAKLILKAKDLQKSFDAISLAAAQANISFCELNQAIDKRVMDMMIAAARTSKRS